MDRKQIERLLKAVQDGQMSVPEAVEQLRRLPFEDLGFSRIDRHRALRRGFPEVVYCQGKRPEHTRAIIRRMIEQGGEVLATRCPPEVAEAVQEEHPKARYYERSRVLVFQRRSRRPKGGLILVVSAGTSDIPVAEEAVVTARTLGGRVEELYDVGVAGIHRLLHETPLLEQASVIVVVAGMEGALASVVSGLVDVPVIAVPTSVGYGASFGGIAALLGMLNSCSAGVVVVNIDNGFGAGYAAWLMHQGDKRRKAPARTGGRSS